MPKRTVEKAARPSAAAEELLLRIKDSSDFHERFATLWRAEMPSGQEPPDMKAFLEFLALGLRRTRTGMVDAAERRERQIAGDGELTAAVDVAHAELSESYVDARALYTFVYGPMAAQAMGFASAKEQRPAPLARRVGTLLRHFRKLPDEVMPAPEARSSFAIKPSSIIEKLEAPHEALRKATRRAKAAVRRARLAVKVKSDHYDEHAGCLSTHTLCGEMLCRMVGLEEEAAQIKATKRRHRE